MNGFSEFFQKFLFKMMLACFIPKAAHLPVAVKTV